MGIVLRVALYRQYHMKPKTLRELTLPVLNLLIIIHINSTVIIFTVCIKILSGYPSRKITEEIKMNVSAIIILINIMPILITLFKP